MRLHSQLLLQMDLQLDRLLRSNTRPGEPVDHTNPLAELRVPSPRATVFDEQFVSFCQRAARLVGWASFEHTPGSQHITLSWWLHDKRDSVRPTRLLKLWIEDSMDRPKYCGCLEGDTALVRKRQDASVLELVRFVRSVCMEWYGAFVSVASSAPLDALARAVSNESGAAATRQSFCAAFVSFRNRFVGLVSEMQTAGSGDNPLRIDVSWQYGRHSRRQLVVWVDVAAFRYHAKLKVRDDPARYSTYESLPALAGFMCDICKRWREMLVSGMIAALSYLSVKCFPAVNDLADKLGIGRNGPV